MLLSTGSPNASFPTSRTRPTPQFVVHFAPMADIPASWKPRLRRLSLGPVEGAMVRWSYHDGSTWATVMLRGPGQNPRNIVGWAVCTLQEDEHPILGTYVAPAHRGQGLGEQLVTVLLQECRPFLTGPLIYAVGDWWPKYGELIERAGYAHEEWG